MMTSPSEAAQPFASDSHHWYFTDGRPCYEVPNKSKPGTMRPTTLRDARALSLVPSVTTILQAAAKPGLEVWKQRQVLMAALTLPRIEGEEDRDFVNRILIDAAEQAKKAAERGTQIHGAIEQLLKGERPESYLDHAGAALGAVNDEFPREDWSSERSFCYADTFGGKVDLYSTAPPWSVVIDFKTKDGDLEDVALYDDHYMQLGAYSLGLGIPDAECAVVFVSRDVPKAVIVRAAKSKIAAGRRQFLALLSYWQAKNNFGLAA